MKLVAKFAVFVCNNLSIIEIFYQDLTGTNMTMHVFFYRFVPTRLWGFNGHVQTVFHTILGRVKCPWPLGQREFLTLEDGTTVTYDLYQPLNSFCQGF